MATLQKLVFTSTEEGCFGEMASQIHLLFKAIHLLLGKQAPRCFGHVQKEAYGMQGMLTVHSARSALCETPCHLELLGCALLGLQILAGLTGF